MADLARRLHDARAEVRRLEQQAAAATCAELGEHDWQMIGGRNAACHDDPSLCNCSVPVHQCSRCGDCDYGDNPEGERIVANCLVTQDPTNDRK